MAQESIRAIIETLNELSLNFPQVKAIVEVISKVVGIVDVRVLLAQMASSEIIT